MTGASWLVDTKRIATKIRCASGSIHPRDIQWKSNPTKSCPNCNYVMDNSDVPHAWPGLPRGVKFDPTDQEIIWHLLAKAGIHDLEPNPFIDEFIPTVEEEDGICYTHPKNLPGVKQDGSVSHFFHKAIKAYNTGTRKRRKILGDDSGDVRWHKTGRTKPVFLDGAQKGCKKIMVLYISPERGVKSGKTNWVMHQYHLGTGEDEKEGDYVISKIFYQQQVQQLTKQQIERGEEVILEAIPTTIAKVDPITPQSVTPEPHVERRFSNHELLQDSTVSPTIEHHEKVDPITPQSVTPEPRVERRFSNHELLQYSTVPPTIEHHENIVEDELETAFEQTNEQHHNNMDYEIEPALEETNVQHPNQNTLQNLDDQVADMSDNEDPEAEDNKWWEDNASQLVLMSTQQLAEELYHCNDLVLSQSPARDETGNGLKQKSKARLSDYACLGPEDLKLDLEECQNMDMACDPANIVLDTPPDFRESQLEFGSQDSYIAWGGSFQGGNVIESEELPRMEDDRLDLS